MTQTNILIVEDEGIIALDLKNKLENLGYRVTGLAASGEEAVEQAIQTPPDLILMDIRLKGKMNGIETAERIRARVDAPIVYLTAYADCDTLERAKITDPFGYILKPFDDQSLRSIIEMALYKHPIEAALQESRERYRLVSELTSDFAYCVRVEPDNNLTAEWVTQAHERITGYPAEEAMETGNWQMLLHPDDLAVAQEHLQTLLSGQPDVSEYRIVTKAGQVRWLRNHAQPVWDDDQARVVRIYAAAQDVTERKQAETALKESEKKFRSLAEQSPNMIFINQRGQIVYANRRCKDVMGYTREEFYASDFDFMSLIVPEDKGLIERNFGLHQQGHDVDPYEYALLTKGGKRIEVIITTKLIDYGGERAILGIVTDISQRKRAERALKFTNAILSTQQETSPHGILVVDQAGQMISFNRRFVEMWGIPPDVLEERSDPRALQAVQGKIIDPDAFLAKIEYLYQHPQEKSRDQINLTDGRIFERYSAPMLGADGQYYGRVWYFRDVTEVKQAEDTLLEHTAELQARNEELNAFAHTVAHDLKNPLALVIGFSETLVQAHTELSEKEIKKYLRSIAQNSRKMENIIDELLLLAQIREEEIELAPLDMGRLVAEAQQRLAHLVEQHQATVITPPDESWPRALGYGPWVEEVWGNYLSNAIQHGGDSPQVELGFDPPTDREVRFWVQDDGPGIPPEKQAKLFVPFTRLAQVRGKGHGLGLSIVRRIVEKLGGQVGVESSGLPGRGSRFSFTLRLADVGPET